METLIDLLEGSAERFSDRNALGLRRDDGTRFHWSYPEVLRRARLAAWRLRSLGLNPGDRVLTWSPSTPALPAAYYGAMYARLIYVPLDSRMSAEAIQNIIQASGAVRLLLGTGRDAPDPTGVGLQDFPTTTIEELSEPPDETFPPDWEAQLAAWERPKAADVFQLVFTSGTTGNPKGVMLAHDNVLAGVGSFHGIIQPMEHRLVSLLPLSHSLEQAVSLFYAMDVGADILYVRSRNPRVIFDSLREHRVTTMLVVPQVLDLFWSAIEREVEKQGQAAMFERLRAIARRLPYWARRLLFRRVHRQLGGGLRLFATAGAFLPPALQQAWEDMGVIVLQGYGATETAAGSCTTMADHPLGCVGWPPSPVEMRIAGDGEIQFRGPTLFKGYWENAEATAAAFTDDGWYKSGDLGQLDDKGRLHLHGRKKDIIVLPNGFNVYPEDLENALRVAGIRDSVALETRPGRIEAIVLGPGGGPAAAASNEPQAPLDDAARAAIDAALKAANQALGPNQRIAGWRVWPEQDFPRTHTLKVKRDKVRAWATDEAHLPVTEGAAASG
ncbi:MAG TPA: AMP-binding protein [Candidatus Limnocylindrales bacterium]|nr:AMP-binding protein [Candidatus Limnocylindrales bacterium]